MSKTFALGLQAVYEGFRWAFTTLSGDTNARIINHYPTYKERRSPPGWGYLSYDTAGLNSRPEKKLVYREESKTSGYVGGGGVFVPMQREEANARSLKDVGLLLGAKMNSVTHLLSASLCGVE